MKLHALSASLVLLFSSISNCHGAVVANYAAGFSAPAADPISQGWTLHSDFTFDGGPNVGQTLPPESGSFNAPNAGPPVAWEIFDVQDNGNDADGMKSGSAIYYKQIGDQTGLEWTYSFTASVRDGAYNDFKVAKQHQTNAFSYWAYEGLNGSTHQWDLWQIELAVVNNNNGTFDLAVLGREFFGGGGPTPPGPNVILLDNVPQAVAEGFYSYDVHYDPLTQEAALWFDSGSGSVQMLSGIMAHNITGLPDDLIAPGSYLAWGAVSEANGGHLLVADVAFTTIPEPTSGFLAVVAFSLSIPTLRRARPAM